MTLIGTFIWKLESHKNEKTASLKSKQIREKHCPSNDPRITNILNNLSLADTGLGNYEKATELSYEIILIRENLELPLYAAYRENTLPINHSNLCRTLHMVAFLEEAEAEGIRAV